MTHDEKLDQIMRDCEDIRTRLTTIEVLNTVDDKRHEEHSVRIETLAMRVEQHHTAYKIGRWALGIVTAALTGLAGLVGKLLAE